MSKIFCKSIIAGILLSFAGAASVFASANIANPSLAILIKSLIFPIGLLSILYGGYTLYTGGVATFLYNTNTNKSVGSYIGALSVSWIGNLIGSVFGALLISLGCKDFCTASFIAIAEAKCAMPWYQAFVLGIGCNFLICYAALQSMKKQDNVKKFCVIFIPVFMFIICRFEHSIANMFYLMYGKLLGADIDIFAVLKSLAFVTLGNFLGGAFYTLYHEMTR